jgi:GNAT superfamily N-acetyltransferase
MIFAEVDGTTVGYGRGRWYRQPDGTVLHDLTGHVAPAWRRRGIGRAILRWTEQRQHRVASQEAEAGPHLFQVDTLDTEDISVGRPWRRRGLATALIMRSLRLL